VVYEVKTERFSISQRSMSQLRVNDNLPEPKGTFTVSYYSSTQSRLHTGSLPGYKLLIASGQNATTEFSGQRGTVAAIAGKLRFVDKRKSSPNNLVSRGETSGHYVTPTSFGLMGVGNVPTTDAVDQAKQKFVSRARSALSSRSGTFLGEIRETVQMLRNPAYALRKGIDGYLGTLVRGVKRRRPVPKLKYAAQTWLEYSYGWKPLISDIAEISGRIASLPTYELERVTGRGSAEYNDSESVTNASAGGFDYEIYERRTLSCMSIYRGAVRLAVGDPAYMLPRNLGFRWDEFVPTAWNLIPYSFLADYFTNIGGILDAWSFSLGSMAWINNTLRKEHTAFKTARNIRRNSIFPEANYLREEEVMNPAAAQTRLWTTHREPNVNSLVPSLRFKVPGTNSNKWINLAALAASHQRTIQSFR